MLGVELSRQVASGLSEQLAKRGVVAGIRGSSLRIAPHLHVTRDDLNTLFGALAEAL